MDCTLSIFWVKQEILRTRTGRAQDDSSPLHLTLDSSLITLQMLL